MKIICLFTVAVCLFCYSLLGAQTVSKQTIAQAILDDIADAAGVVQVPKLEIVNNVPNLVADYNPNIMPNGLIRLSEKTYDICHNLQNQFKGALAVILSHELMHHYRRHQQTIGYAFANKSAANPKQVRQTEAEADSLGLFYAYAAGYSVLTIAPNLLDILYKNYQFPEKTDNYPSLAERRKTAQNMSKNLQTYAPVWEASKYLYILGGYEQAANGFELLVNKLPACKMYYNAGIAWLMAYIANTKPEDAPYIYPIEIDPTNRFSPERGSSGEISNIRRCLGTKCYIDGIFLQVENNAYLEKAQKNLQKATAIDPDYEPAQMAWAITYHLLGKDGTALDLLDDLLKKDPKNGNAYCLRAIIHSKNKKCEAATADFNTAITYKGYFAAENKQLMRTKDGTCWTWAGWTRDMFPSTTSKNPIRNPDAEMIDGVTCAKLPTASSTNKKPITAGTWDLKFFDQYANAYWIKAAKGDLKILATPPNYSGKTAANLSVANSNATDITNAYGQPTRKVAAVGGTYWVYNNCRLAFCVDKHERLRGWFLWK